MSGIRDFDERRIDWAIGIVAVAYVLWLGVMWLKGWL